MSDEVGNKIARFKEVNERRKSGDSESRLLFLGFGSERDERDLG